MINKYSKPRILIMAMCDNITGEAVGESFESLYGAGAKNVQVMNTVTKKNRPGYLYVIDCDEACVDEIEEVLIREIGTTGWHRINSEHCYTDVEYMKKTIAFSYEGKTITEEAACKYSPNVPEPYRVERECLDMLQKKIEASLKVCISRQRLSHFLTLAFQDEELNCIELDN